MQPIAVSPQDAAVSRLLLLADASRAAAGSPRARVDTVVRRYRLARLKLDDGARAPIRRT